MIYVLAVAVMMLWVTVMELSERIRVLEARFQGRWVEKAK